MAQFDALAKRHKEEQKRLDSRAAQIVWAIAEVNRDRKARPKAYTLEDFMPQEPKPKPKMTANELAESMKQINLLLGGEEI